MQATRPQRLGATTAEIKDTRLTPVCVCTECTGQESCHMDTGVDEESYTARQDCSLSRRLGQFDLFKDN